LNRLWIKLTLAFVAVAVLAVAIVAVVVLRATGNEFRRYVVRSNMMLSPIAIESLAAYYTAFGTWEGVEPLLLEIGPGQGMGQMMGGRGRGSGFRLVLAGADGRVVAYPSGELLGQALSSDLLAHGVPIETAGQQAGTLLTLATAELVLDDPGQAFLDAVRRALLWAAAAAVALALFSGLLVSRRLTLPLRRLTSAAGVIASGDLSQRVNASGDDEIAELGRAFNDMATSLGEAETLRRHVMADVAHELRTPLAVIQGNLQAMLDGVYPLDQEQIASLYDETRLLTRLVDDLRDLALAEAGQLRLEEQAVDLGEIAQSAAANFGPPAEAAGVTLRVNVTPQEVIVMGDRDRLAQIIRNLVGNALRHTPSCGQIGIGVKESGGQAYLIVQDTGSGIAAEDLPHIFDRFYRADKSHSRRSGAGLGLTIARQLALAQGGDITVESLPGLGATFTLSLPRASDHAVVEEAGYSPPAS
jgi:two-component system OmpR family sensor kinase/two-component system sensor histidine kinase BaeS